MQTVLQENSARRCMTTSKPSHARAQAYQFRRDGVDVSGSRGESTGSAGILAGEFPDQTRDTPAGMPALPVLVHEKPLSLLRMLWDHEPGRTARRDPKLSSRRDE